MENRQWNDLHHIKNNEDKPKQKYVKMSDRYIQIDPKLDNQESVSRSRSVIHSSAKASTSIPGAQRYGN